MTSLAEIARDRRVIVCCGSGGVGKTTAAAAIALHAARSGRRAVVVTIDPAKRLANALGLDALDNRPTKIDPSLWNLPTTPGGDAGREDPSPSGELSALMLDVKSTFDGLVQRYSTEPGQAQRILDNSFYRNISGALGGTQEYMAMEKLHELSEEAAFDLIVVDTPPTRHALDFLDAPERLTRMLDNRIFRLLMMPTRAYLKVASVAVQAFLRTVSRVVGSDVIDDIVAFLRAFEGMEEGFRERAVRVGELIADPSTAFVLVSSPRRDAVTEAEFFAAKLAESSLSVGALVVNRVHPLVSDADEGGLRLRAEELSAAGGDDAERLAELYRRLAELVAVAKDERHQLEGINDRLGSAPTVYVPLLAHDVHDFATLSELGALLFAE